MTGVSMKPMATAVRRSRRMSALTSTSRLSSASRERDHPAAHVDTDRGDDPADEITNAVHPHLHEFGLGRAAHDLRHGPAKRGLRGRSLFSVSTYTSGILEDTSISVQQVESQSIREAQPFTEQPFASSPIQIPCSATTMVARPPKVAIIPAATPIGELGYPNGDGR